MNKSQVLRGMLLQAGISIEPEPEHPYASRGAALRAGAPIDRATIADTLRAGGVPEHRIAWMATSCPSLERAREYVASLTPAWAARAMVTRPIEGETYEDERGRWFRVDEVNDADPDGRYAIGVLMADHGTGAARAYSCAVSVFQKIWRDR